MIVPPFAGVRLVEYRDRFELEPYYWIREFVGLGRCKASDIEPPSSPFSRAVFQAMAADGEELWVIARWHRYEDGREEAINLNYLDSQTTEARAREEFERMGRFANLTKEELVDLTKLFRATEDDLAYIENRFPDIKAGPPDKKSLDDYDVYQARLKVLAGMQPKTVALIHRAEQIEDEAERAKVEREMVDAFFADMAHYWTEDMVKEWQRSNPVGTEWLCEFARVMQEPEKDLDPINYELARNWLVRKYNLMTAEELSDAILVATGQRVAPGTLKKRRERLGLTTKRRPGPLPNDSR